jgi:hypothetical protein
MKLAAHVAEGQTHTPPHPTDLPLLDPSLDTAPEKPRHCFWNQQPEPWG